MSHLARRTPAPAVTDLAESRPARPFFRPRRRVSGTAFEISDLLLAQACAAYHGVRLQIRLDHTGGGTDYEEVLQFNTGRTTLSGITIWRCAGGVMLSPTLGRRKKFDSLAQALQHLLPEAEPDLTDITPCGWPKP
jgi:hypothetical protein